MATHARNLGPMNEAPRCGARTRVGTLCQSPAISGKSRCRMHGGKGSGAPKGNRNAVRHGVYTKDVFEREVRVRGLCQRLRVLVKALESERLGGASVAGRNPSLPKAPTS
jgi:glucans biosynthesis protein